MHLRHIQENFENPILLMIDGPRKPWTFDGFKKEFRRMIAEHRLKKLYAQTRARRLRNQALGRIRQCQIVKDRPTWTGKADLINDPT